MAPQVSNSKPFIELLKHNHVPIIVGGAYTTLDVQTIMKEINPTYINIGYGFNTIKQILNNKKLIKQKISNKKNVHFLSDFPTKLPQLNFQLINLNDYIYFEDEYKTISFLSSIGCENGCAFCINSINKRWVGHSPLEIFKSINYLHESYGIQYFRFIDDNPFQKPNRMLKLFELLNNYDNSLKFYFDVPIKVINSKIFDSIHKYIHKIYTGVETISEKLQTNIQKNLKKSQIENAVNKLVSYDIKAKYSFIVGLPNETRKDIQDLKNFISWIKHRQPLAEISIKRYMPIPGTKLSEIAHLSNDKGISSSLEININEL